MLDDLKEYNPRDENHISDKSDFLKNIQNFYNGREMVINAFANKLIPLADGSYPQYFEREPDEEIDTYWMEKPDTFNEILKEIKEEAEKGVNVNFEKKKGQKSRNVN